MTMFSKKCFNSCCKTLKNQLEMKIQDTLYIILTVSKSFQRIYFGSIKSQRYNKLLLTYIWLNIRVQHIKDYLKLRLFCAWYGKCSIFHFTKTSVVISHMTAKTFYVCFLWDQLNTQEAERNTCNANKDQALLLCAITTVKWVYYNLHTVCQLNKALLCKQTHSEHFFATSIYTSIFVKMQKLT